METSNLGFYFNKGYYSDKYQNKEDYINVLKKIKEDKDEKSTNTEIENLIEAKVDDKMMTVYQKLGDTFENNSKIVSFELETAYPGVIAGIGYAHNSLAAGEFQNGFYFDYTTGFPVIPGSSIKGVLRNAFPNQMILKAEWYKRAEKNAVVDFEGFENHFKSEFAEDELIEKYHFYCTEKSKLEYIKEKLEDIRKNLLSGLSESFKIILEEKINSSLVETLEKEVFENQGVVFFDAYSLLTKGDIILADDYITRHVKSIETEQDDLFDNPTPIRILKLNPGTKLKFNFKFSDKLEVFNLDSNELEEKFFEIRVELIEEIKIRIFEQILVDFGIGAKTSVGYGYFSGVTRTKKDKNYFINKIKEVTKYEQEKYLEGKSESFKIYYLQVDQLEASKKLDAAKRLLSKRKEGDLAEEELIKLAEIVKKDLEDRNKFKYNAKKEAKDKDIKNTKIVCEILGMSLPMD